MASSHYTTLAVILKSPGALLSSRQEVQIKGRSVVVWRSRVGATAVCVNC